MHLVMYTNTKTNAKMAWDYGRDPVCIHMGKVHRGALLDMMGKRLLGPNMHFYWKVPCEYFLMAFVRFN